jgi:hypothetical protein
LKAPAIVESGNPEPTVRHAEIDLDFAAETQIDDELVGVKQLTGAISTHSVDRIRSDGPVARLESRPFALLSGN